ncbi:MAG: DUF4340 domain-containing protein [Phycisphaerales bacterium]|nr:DUF4340 domain-containing protein [Planctomycetota bacterium]MBL6997782.1 DUF4340 domain-containing protein [Phycisphaerales bacterium]
MILRRDIWILCCIAVVSSVFAISIHNKEIAKSSETSEHLIQTQSLHFDAIQKIVLHKNGRELEFTFNDGEWWQVLPFEMRMDSASMLALIRSVQGVQRIGDITEETKLPTLGLGDNSNWIALSDGNETITIHLGRKTLAGRAYAQVGDSPPVIVDQSLHRRAIDMDHKLWRDVRLLPDFTIDGESIERVVRGDRLHLQQSGGSWEMREPVNARVDYDILTEWIGRIAAMRVGSFVIDEPTNLDMFGLLDPVATFSVSNRNGTTHNVLVGSRVSANSQDRYVMLADRPVVFKIQWKILSQLFPASEIFVDSTGSAVSRFDVKRVSIRSNNSEVLLIRNVERWLDKDGVPFDTNQVDDLLTWLLETKPPSVAIGQYPKIDEIATITLEGYDLKPLDTIRVASNPDGGVILENGDNVLRLHPDESQAFLQPFLK